MKTAILIFSLLSGLAAGATQVAPAGGRAAADAVVGPGAYPTVQAAIDAAPARSPARWRIRIAPGTYHGAVHIPRGKAPLSLAGDDPTTTRLTFDRKATDPGADGAAIGTFRSASVFIEGDDVIIDNLTIENGAGPAGQAVALRVEGDRVIIRNSRLLGWQDTLLLNRGRQYLEDTFIAGHVDFVFGGATAYFKRCHLHAWRNGYLTAASTPADQKFGFVFVDSIVTGEPEVRTYLGRPWRDFAQTAFIRTVMGAAVVAAGWHNWDHPERERTARYSEVGSSGPGALNLSQRVTWTRPLTPADADQLTPAAVLGGADNWNPLTAPALPSPHQANAAPLPAAPGPAAVIAAWQGTTVTWDRVLVQPAAWYGSADAARIADNVLRYQRHTGGWPKNIDMARPLTDDERDTLARDRSLDDSTIDNDATAVQIRFLATVTAAGGPPPARAGMLAGLDYLLRAQYPNGGWPQYFPLRKDYSKRITFNDNAIVNVLAILGDVADSRAPFAGLDPALRARARAALDRGHQVVLSTQIKVGGRLTGWCQQYDEVTLQPASARTYEHPSISGLETAAILTYLMKLERPDAATIAAIDAGMAWLAQSKITGLRVEQRPDPAGPAGYDVVAVPDAGAPPVWARFYDIATNAPMFSGRDSVIKTRLDEIEIERRAGYNWYGTWPRELLDTQYPAWKLRHKR